MFWCSWNSFENLFDQYESFQLFPRKLLLIFLCEKGRKYSRHFSWKQSKRILLINKVVTSFWNNVFHSYSLIRYFSCYFFQSTLKLITTKLRFLPRLGKKTHTQSISFCHASLAQFASGDDALLSCNTSLFFCVISSLWKVSLVQFFRCEIENALEALITLFQKV